MDISDDEYSKLSDLGDRPEEWDGLSDEDLKNLVLLKCIEYGVSQDAARIPSLFSLYRHAQDRFDVQERMALLNLFSQMTEEQKGLGYMGLMMFLVAENDRSICSTAAMSLAVLYQPSETDELAGPRFVVNNLIHREGDPETQGAALGGILLLGDKRLLPLLEDAWSQLSEDARVSLAAAKSGFAYEGVIEFWLRCLEKGCSEAVFGSVVAAIAKMPVIAAQPFVFDVRREFPAYSESNEPIQFLNRTAFSDYLEQIRPRLDKLEKVESEPKVIPRVYEIWEHPEQFRGIVG